MWRFMPSCVRSVTLWNNVDDSYEVLSIVIVSHCTETLLRDCLRSPRSANIGVNHETVVVDNTSADGSCAMIEREFPECVLIRNARNMMFGDANNQGMELVVRRHLSFLNPDTIVAPVQLNSYVALQRLRVGIPGRL